MILYTCFGYFGHAWLRKPKVILSTCRKLSCLFAGKKSTSPALFFWRYCKDMQTSYFGYFGHAWLHNQLVEDFSVYLQVQNIFHYSLLFWDITFKRILQFDWLTAFRLITQEPEFCQIWDCGGISTISVFILDIFQKKRTTKFFKKSQKPYFGTILGPFCPNLGKK